MSEPTDYSGHIPDGDSHACTCSAAALELDELDELADRLADRMFARLVELLGQAHAGSRHPHDTLTTEGQ